MPCLATRRLNPQNSLHFSSKSFALNIYWWSTYYKSNLKLQIMCKITTTRTRSCYISSNHSGFRIETSFNQRGCSCQKSDQFRHILRILLRLSIRCTIRFPNLDDIRLWLGSVFLCSKTHIRSCPKDLVPIILPAQLNLVVRCVSHIQTFVWREDFLHYCRFHPMGQYQQGYNCWFLLMVLQSFDSSTSPVTSKISIIPISVTSLFDIFLIYFCSFHCWHWSSLSNCL
jgi:hypothetical protein